jgi:hypothetical protein
VINENNYLAGGMTGADIGVGWVYPSGQLVFQVNK